MMAYKCPVCGRPDVVSHSNLCYAEFTRPGSMGFTWADKAAYRRALKQARRKRMGSM
jgi:rRNA maturation protein Nop10